MLSQPSSPSALSPSKRTLPAALQEKLNEKGFAVEKPDLCLDLGSEKVVYDGVRLVDRGEFCVVHSKVSREGGWRWDFKTALRVFEAVQGPGSEGGHPNIIRMHECIQPDAENRFGPCMVLQKVEPLGYDMFTVHEQYQRARRIMPISQLTHYVEQVSDGLAFLHSLGWVHCDLKVDNVLIDKDHQGKIIDFGYCRQSSVDRCTNASNQVYAA